jgi:hypothetical protein
VQIIEILDRSTQGVTKPFICRAEDDNIYFVKGRGAGKRSLICEWLASSLGAKMGLPVPSHHIVEIPGSLIDLGSRHDLAELGSGPAFGSQRQQLVELSMSRLGSVPVGLQRQVLAFDWWIRNADRTLSVNGGNPNLFWNVEQAQLVVLDHNLAFDEAFNADDFLALHAFRSQSRHLFGDWVTQQELCGICLRAMEGWDAICNAIPDEWTFVDPERTIPVSFDFDALRTRLLDCENDAFWNPKL